MRISKIFSSEKAHSFRKLAGSLFGEQSCRLWTRSKSCHARSGPPGGRGVHIATLKVCSGDVSRCVDGPGIFYFCLDRKKVDIFFGVRSTSKKSPFFLNSAHETVTVIFPLQIPTPNLKGNRLVVRQRSRGGTPPLHIDMI